VGYHKAFCILCVTQAAHRACAQPLGLGLGSALRSPQRRKHVTGPLVDYQSSLPTVTNWAEWQTGPVTNWAEWQTGPVTNWACDKLGLWQEGNPAICICSTQTPVYFEYFFAFVGTFSFVIFILYDKITIVEYVRAFRIFLI